MDDNLEPIPEYFPPIPTTHQFQRESEERKRKYLEAKNGITRDEFKERFEQECLKLDLAEGRIGQEQFPMDCDTRMRAFEKDMKEIRELPIANSAPDN